jgi:hypothetical protein
MVFKHIEPGADPDRTPLDGYGYLGVEPLCPLLRFPGCIVLVLIAVTIDLLLEIAPTTDEAYRDQRQPKVCRGAHGIAREDAEAARVTGDVVLQRNLH